MIKGLWKLSKHYWELASLALVVLIAVLSQVLNQHSFTTLILGIGGSLLTIPLLVNFWTDFRNGSYGFGFLALVAAYDALALRQFWLMITIIAVAYASQLFEQVASRQSNQSVERLRARMPEVAHIIRGRKTMDISALAIQAGDKIQIKAGEVVPVEAVILEGSSQFDESALGHSYAAVSKSSGDQLVSGSLNQEQTVVVRALNSVGDSQYQQIIKIISTAGAQQAPFVRQAERFGWFFTLIALLIAGGAWFTHHQALRFLEVIIVAAPGPLILAPSVALLAGMYRASRLGIIIRTGSGFERLAKAQTFGFAKLGVISTATPIIDNVSSVEPYSRQEILSFAASLTAAAMQPVAQAIIASADDQPLTISKVKHFQIASDQTLSGSLKGYRLLVGQAEQLIASGITIDSTQLVKQAALYVAINDTYAGSITFKDEPVAEAKATLKTLRQLGIKFTILLGSDSETALKQAAKKAGIGDVFAAAIPGAQLHALEKLPNRPVVFVGNGQKDAPLLTTADVGIALGAQGSTVAGEAADIIILGDSLDLVSKALIMSRQSFNAAKLSIAFGSLLSLGLMLGFAIGHVSPWIGVGLPLLITATAVSIAGQAAKRDS